MSPAPTSPPRWRFRGAALAALLLFASPPTLAHFFVQPYALPIPFWMYGWGAAGALLLSFIAAGMFAVVQPRLHKSAVGVAVIGLEQTRASSTSSPWRYLALGLLVLCILSGLTGPAKSFDNFNMTFFWILFVLGIPYLTAIIGNFYARVNPWLAMVELFERFTGHPFTGWIKQPERLGHWPAVLLYVGFIVLELFGHLLPRGLSGWLLVYSAVNVAGAWLLGRQAWFKQGEFFGVMLRLIGKMAPLESTRTGWRFRKPFSGLLLNHPNDLGLVVFILFMLSSTAFDGMHATKPWVDFFWYCVNPILTGGWGLSPREQNNVSVFVYQGWQRLTLIASPFLYLAIFALVLISMNALVCSRLTVRLLLCKFAHSMIPIAFVYHFTHYFTLLLTQGGQVIRLISDPLGVGWNLFGTSKWTIPPIMVDMGKRVVNPS